MPFNPRIGSIEIPAGLAAITATLFALCVINLFTKQIATMAGIVFTLMFVAVFTISERTTRKRVGARAELDQFNLDTGSELTPETLGVRPGSVLVPVGNYNTLYNLKAVLDRADTQTQDVVVLHLRVLQRAGEGESELTPEQLFSLEEQKLFTYALQISEAKGKTVHLAVAAATNKWNGMLTTARSLRASMVVVGASTTLPATEEARLAGLAWERLPDPKPQVTLSIWFPGGQEQVFYLGPHAPHLTPKELEVLHRLWLELSKEVAPEELHHRDIVHFALNNLQEDLERPQRADIIGALGRHLQGIKSRRARR